MKHFIKIIIYFVSDLFGLIKPFIYHLQYQHFTNEIKNTNPQKPLCVLGNGPSAKQVIDNLIGDNSVDVCTVNFCGNSDYFFSLKPHYYIFSDPAFYQKQKENEFSRLFNNFKKIDWEMTLYMPYYFPKSFKRLIETNKKITVLHFCQVDWCPRLIFFNKIKCFLYKKGLLAPNIKNVIIPSICTGLLRGYHVIYLYGVEHSWTKFTFVDEKNQVMILDEHFYGTSVRPWMSEGKPCKMHTLMRMMHDVFKSYWYVREFADYLGNVEIINCTNGSFIDAFERKNDSPQIVNANQRLM